MSYGYVIMYFTMASLGFEIVRQL